MYCFLHHKIINLKQIAKSNLVFKLLILLESWNLDFISRISTIFSTNIYKKNSSKAASRPTGRKILKWRQVWLWSSASYFLNINFETREEWPQNQFHFLTHQRHLTFHNRSFIKKKFNTHLSHKANSNEHASSNIKYQF